MAFHDWLTVDRAIALGAIAVSGLAAAFAALGYYLARATRLEARRARWLKLLLAVGETPRRDGFHLAQLTLLEPIKQAKYWIIELEVIRPRGAIICPIQDDTFKPRDYSGLVPLTVQSSRRHEVRSWRWLSLDETRPDQSTMLFFVRSQKTASSRLSLRLTIEEISPSRERTIVAINSNPIAWRPITPPSTARISRSRDQH
jgi:hypothetical protein